MYFLRGILEKWDTKPHERKMTLASSERDRPSEIVFSSILPLVPEF